MKIIYCPNCGELVKQKLKVKTRFYCNQKCYYELRSKIGYFRKHMQIYFKDHPEARIRANQKAKEWYKAHG